MHHDHDDDIIIELAADDELEAEGERAAYLRAAAAALVDEFMYHDEGTQP